MKKEMRFDDLKEIIKARGFKRSSTLKNAATFNMRNYKLHVLFEGKKEQYVKELAIELLKKNKSTNEIYIFTVSDTLEQITKNLDDFIKIHALVYFEDYYNKFFMTIEEVKSNLIYFGWEQTHLISNISESSSL